MGEVRRLASTGVRGILIVTGENIYTTLAKTDKISEHLPKGVSLSDAMITMLDKYDYKEYCAIITIGKELCPQLGLRRYDSAVESDNETSASPEIKRGSGDAAAASSPEIKQGSGNKAAAASPEIKREGGEHSTPLGELQLAHNQRPPSAITYKTIQQQITEDMGHISRAMRARVEDIKQLHLVNMRSFMYFDCKTKSGTVISGTAKAFSDNTGVSFSLLPPLLDKYVGSYVIGKTYPILISTSVAYSAIMVAFS